MGVNRDTGLSFPHLYELAHAFDMPCYEMCPLAGTVFGLDKIKHVINQVFNENGPAICEIMMSPDQPQAPRFLNRRNPDGTMNPTKLEDSFPFLDPEEVAEQMRIAE